jgi:arylsulfatase A-like enzyme
VIRSAAILLCLAALPACTRAVEPRGVVLIVVDTLRADHLGCYGYERPTSPELDAIAAQGVLFENAFATSPWTLPSVASILTGQLPSRHAAGTQEGERGKGRYVRLDDSVPTLAGLLSEAGVTTAAFVNNPYLGTRYGLGRGFELYDHRTTSNRELRRADEMVDLALAWLDEQAQGSFFVLVHLFDPHMDYDPPPATRGRYTHEHGAAGALPIEQPKAIQDRAASMPEAERELIRAAYDEEVAFVDRELGRLFAALRERGLDQSVLVLATADHGEELFDHGGFEHGHSVHGELIHVPLIAWGAGVAPRRASAAVSIVDLAPTILEALGVEVAAEMFGRSLWPHIRGGEAPRPRPLVVEETLRGPMRRALIRWPLKLEQEVESGALRLFDLERDPLARSDLARERSAEAQRLAALLEALVAAAGQAAEIEEAELDDETLESLRALGYVR